MIQQLVVAVIVAFAAFAVIKRYAPATFLRFVRTSMARLARKLSLNGLASKIESASSSGSSCSTGCGSCKGCGSASASGDSEANNTITPDALKRTIYSISKEN